MAGRKTKLTPELQERIVNYVRSGVWLETAAAAAGIDKSTLHRWLKEGREVGRNPYADFARAVDEALAQDEIRNAIQLEGMANATATHEAKCTCGKKVSVRVPVPDRVQLAALTWKLERKHPDRYGGKIRLQVQAEVEHKLRSSIEELLERVRERVDHGTYARLVMAIAAEMGEPELAQGPAAVDTTH